MKAQSIKTIYASMGKPIKSLTFPKAKFKKLTLKSLAKTYKPIKINLKLK